MAIGEFPRMESKFFWVSLIALWGAWMFWLGGLDSNQDSQIQSLESYQLDDLPAEGRTITEHDAMQAIAPPLQPY